MSKNDIVLIRDDIINLTDYIDMASSVVRYMHSKRDSDLLDYVVTIFDDAIFYKIEAIRNRLDEIEEKED